MQRLPSFLSESRVDAELVNARRPELLLADPVHAVPYTPARHFAKGKGDPAFGTKLAIDADLAIRARAAGFALRGGR